MPRTGDDGLTAAEVQERVGRGQTNDTGERTSRTLGEIVRANVFTRFNAILGAMLAVIVVVGPIQDATFGARAGRQRRHRHRPGGAGQAHPRPARGAERAACAGRARRQRRRRSRSRRSCSTTCSSCAPATRSRATASCTRADGLEIDESLLTGESDPINKADGDEVLSGSFVVAGSGRFQATRVGADSYARKLAAEARRFQLTRSELMDGINTILRIVTWVLIPVVGAAALEPAAATTTLDERAARHGRRGGGHGARGPRAAHEHRVRGRRAHPGPAQGAGAGAARGRRPGPRRRRLPRQDRDPHRGRDRVRRGRAARRQRRRPSARRARRARRRREPQRHRSSRSPRRSRRPTAGRAPAAVPFSSARKWSAATFDGQGSWVMGAPEMVLADASLAGARRGPTSSPPAGAACSCSRTADARARRARRCRPGSQPVALVMFAEKVRPDAAETLRYFHEQGVHAQGDLGRQPAHGGRGRRSASGCPDADDRVRRPRAARGPATSWPRRSSSTRCSAGSRRSRSGRWSARCSRRATSSR